VSKSFWIETLGCPKNKVDSEKIAGTLLLDGLEPADSPTDANLIVVNTCSFVEEAREESIETVFELSQLRADDVELVVTGCLAERYGDDIVSSLKNDVDAVVGFGVPVSISTKPNTPKFDLLNLPRPKRDEPWGTSKLQKGAIGFVDFALFLPSGVRSVPDQLLIFETKSCLWTYRKLF